MSAEVKSTEVNVDEITNADIRAIETVERAVQVASIIINAARSAAATNSDNASALYKLAAAAHAKVEEFVNAVFTNLLNADLAVRMAWGNDDRDASAAASAAIDRYDSEYTAITTMTYQVIGKWFELEHETAVKEAERELHDTSEDTSGNGNVFSADPFAADARAVSK
jgi:hypothetical protein